MTDRRARDEEIYMHELLADPTLETIPSTAPSRSRWQQKKNFAHNAMVSTAALGLLPYNFAAAAIDAFSDSRIDITQGTMGPRYSISQITPEGRRGQRAGLIPGTVALAMQASFIVTEPKYLLAVLGINALSAVCIGASHLYDRAIETVDGWGTNPNNA